METLEAVFITFVSAIPVSVLLTYSYPFLCANKRANSEGSTIIGEVSLEEYADSSVVTLADKIIFPSTEVKVQNIRIYNNNRIDSVLYYVSSVFSKAGGPLSDVFNLSTVETGHSENVEITENAVGCLSATVDGHLLVFGRVDELAERGLQISDEITDEDSYLAGENSVMYMFIDGVLGAKMFIRYSIDPDFAEIAESLAQDGMSLCIETQDPNIDDKTVAAHIMIDEFPVKVLKTPVGTSNDNVCEELDSGIVARGSADALLRTVTYCNKILRVRKTDFSIGVFGMLTAVAAVFVLALLGKLDVVSSLLVAIYQLIWMLPVLITSKLFIK